MTMEIPYIDDAIPDGDDERRKYERRKGWHTPDTCSRVLGVHAQVEEVKQQISATHEKIAVLETKLDANNKATDELLEIIQMGKGFFKTMWTMGKWVRRIILFIAPVVTALITMWYAITNRPQ